MKPIVRMLAVATAVLSLGVHAEDDDDLLSVIDDSSSSGAKSEVSDAGEAASGESVDGDKAGDADLKVPKVSEKTFYILPFCRRLEGKAKVLIPGSQAWVDIEEGKYYPLGTAYSTVDADSRLSIMFGPRATVEIKGQASFSTRAQPLNEPGRSVALISGRIDVKLPPDLKEGLFSVTAPGFTAKNLAGESRFTYSKLTDGDEAVIRCVTQTMSIEGAHFNAPALRAANEIRIRTSQDQLMTAIYGQRGDVLVRLDQGLVVNKDFATGEGKVEPKFLDWKLSPQTAIRIHRIKPSVGERLAVTTMTFGTRGELRNRCAFTENMVEVNSGELGPTTKKEREALAKRAAELSKSQDVTDAAAETNDSDAEDTEEKDSSAASSDGDDLEF